MTIYGAIVWSPTSNNPTLAEVRGKVVILQNFSGATEGINYNTLDIQDNYSMGDNWDLHDKWIDVKNHFIKANNGSRDTIYMNYLSASGGSFPYFVSSGHSSPGTSAPRLATGLTTSGWGSSYPEFPRVDCFIGICTIAFEGTNILSKDFIANGGTSFTGIVMADFPGEGLINNIIELNYEPATLKSNGFLGLGSLKIYLKYRLQDGTIISNDVAMEIVIEESL